MYEYISGTVAEATPAYAVIDAGGVGYYLHISLETFSAVEHAQNARLYVHYIVREDAQILYGFATKVEREFFRHLISVSGVGGNTARMILSTYSPRELQGIITSGNAVLLKNVKGLGLKTAHPPPQFGRADYLLYICGIVFYTPQYFVKLACSVNGRGAPTRIYYPLALHRLWCRRRSDRYLRAEAAAAPAAQRPAERLLPLMAGRDLDGFGRLFFVPGTLTGAFFAFHALKSDCFCKFAR